MTKHINSAYRIKEILNSISKNSDKAPLLDIWGDIFSIKETDRQRKSFAISRCLADLHDEVEFVRSEMMKLGYSEYLYSPSLTKCNAIFSAQMLMGEWHQLKQQLTPEVPIALGFCSEVLPNEETLIEDQSLEELRKMASELRSSLVDSILPAHTKNIIEKHIDKIEDAIAVYVAVGARGLEDALQSAYGEVISNESVFKDAKGSEELGKLSQMWQKTKSILDGVVDANKRLGATQGMAEKGLKVIEFLKDLNV